MQTSSKENVGVKDTFQRIIEEAAHAKLINMAYDKPDDAKNKVIYAEADLPKKRSCTTC